MKFSKNLHESYKDYYDNLLATLKCVKLLTHTHTQNQFFLFCEVTSFNSGDPAILYRKNSVRVMPDRSTRFVTLPDRVKKQEMCMINM
jgi:hypothetical protein